MIKSTTANIPITQTRQDTSLKHGQTTSIASQVFQRVPFQEHFPAKEGDSTTIKISHTPDLTERESPSSSGPHDQDTLLSIFKDQTDSPSTLPLTDTDSLTSQSSHDAELLRSVIFAQEPDFFNDTQEIDNGPVQTSSQNVPEAVAPAIVVSTKTPVPHKLTLEQITDIAREAVGTPSHQELAISAVDDKLLVTEVLNNPQIRIKTTSQKQITTMAKMAPFDIKQTAINSLSVDVKLVHAQTLDRKQQILNREIDKSPQIALNILQGLKRSQIASFIKKLPKEDQMAILMKSTTPEFLKTAAINSIIRTMNEDMTPEQLYKFLEKRLSPEKLAELYPEIPPKPQTP
jgi:hypothetical protein